ncbi:MAG: allantoinase AllB [Myxococcota bacterium]
MRGRCPSRGVCCPPCRPQWLRSERVLLPHGLAPAAVAIADGRIRTVADAAPPGAPVDDLGDDVLLPALTDTHVHLNEPGRTAWEGFDTGTRAAAAGGVTRLVDMPLNCIPVTTTAEALRRKRQAAEGQLWVDVSTWGGVIPGNDAELREMVALGALGFKAFLCPSGIDEFPASTADDLRRAMPILRDLGVPLLVHAELEGPLRDPAPSEDPRAYARYLHSRPKEWEDRAVALVAALVAETGCRAHIVHLSSDGALAVVREAHARGLPLTAETCPHYLGLAAEDVPDGDTAYKCAPPIRERDNREALWQALQDGTLAFVVTDHSPCLPALKRLDTGDFGEAWGGIASLQLGLRSVWTEAHRRGLPLERVVGWMAEGPARWLGLADRGAVRPGAVADLVRFRPDPVAPLDPATLLHRHPTTPWAGRPLRGEVAATWLRGEPVWADGRIVGQARGRFVGGEGA